MKLFNAIAAAAILGASLITANPAEARNGWMFMGHSDGHPVYWRSRGYRGNICQVEINFQGKYTQWFNCNSWQYAFKDKVWKDLMPESAAEYRANQVCG